MCSDSDLSQPLNKTTQRFEAPVRVVQLLEAFLDEGEPSICSLNVEGN